jgi:hypothetical protein
MSADATISVDTSDLNKALQGLAIATGKDADTIIIEESRLFAEQAMRRTPPRTLAQGRRAVARDIKKILSVASEELIRKAIDWHGGEDHVRQNFTRKDGSTYLIEWNHTQLGSEGIEAHHNRHRDKRGRVSTAGDRERTIGRWKARDKWIVPHKVRADYIKEKQSNVGKLKAGWMPSVRLFHGKAPGYVRRHNPRGSAQFRGARTNDVRAIMTNTAKGASGIDRFLKQIVRIRLSAIMRKIRLTQSGYAKDFARQMRIQTRARRTR